MRSILIFLVLTCLLVEIKGQSESSDFYNNAFGMDASFVNVLLPLTNTIGEDSPYLFSFRQYRKENKFLRFNVDLNFKLRVEDEEDSFNSDDSQFELDFRLGEGKEVALYKDLSYVYGYDFLLGTEFENSKTELEDGENVRKKIGLEFGSGVFFGFSYKIFERLFIYAEGGYYLILNNLNESFSNERNPNLDFNTKVFQIETRSKLPTSIVIFFKF